MLGSIVLAVMVLTPMGREWVLFVAMGGDWYTPKGFPTQSREWDKPTDPRELEAYEYAHALKLPGSLPKPVPFNFARYLFSNRRTTAIAYFDHICATEAGEYIFRTVDKVEGIYQMRTMPKREDKVMTDRYAFEDPADWSQGEGSGSPTLFLGGPRQGFRYFESKRSPEEIASKYTVEDWQIIRGTESETIPYWRYHNFGFPENSGIVNSIQQLESRYAYTWRGILREADRKHGISGGELIVLDQITGEILGVRRSFAIARQNKTRLSWEFAYYCPKNRVWRNGTKVLELNKLNYPQDFISQVLYPIDFGLNPSRITQSTSITG
ncbi:hypothetical protein FACS189441_2000 [Betaproteobacteria bacterium]|nr:hypothetical protein FACS189441_2000 [Betaproteobacteria bacterium]